MLESFDFGAPGIAGQLTGTLATLQHYNALRVHADYFEEAMGRLRQTYLNVALDTVLHPVSPAAGQAAKAEQAAASAAPSVTERELTAQEWFERGFKATDRDEQVRFYSEAIRLRPDFADAYNNRGWARQTLGDREGAVRDYSDALRLRPDFVRAFNNRFEMRRSQGDLEGALKDCNDALRLRPNFAEAFHNRGVVRYLKNDLEGAVEDYGEALRLKPNLPYPYYWRALIWQTRDNPAEAIADFQQFLNLGGGVTDGFKEKAEEMIRELKKRL